MSYSPSTNADRTRMLRTIGVDSIDDLFVDIPAAHRDPTLDLPEALPEVDVLREVRALAERNRVPEGAPSFLGAGFYRHFVPALVDQQLLRSEWYTGYTPYQAEMTQGTLQSMYEFQSLVCRLTGMEVANASLYDGATALAEAVLMCRAITRRSGVVMAGTVHPAYREVAATYTQAVDVEIRTIDAWIRTGENVAPDIEAVAAAIDDTTACVVLQRPDFFGWVVDPAPVVEAAERHGAKIVYVVTDPISLGLLTPPGELGADIVAGELRSLVGPPIYGGPGAGMLATRQAFIRRLPGRIAGRTTDIDGQQGFVLTLQTREQHIRRERATSNITTNQALVALGAAISISALGPGGLRGLATQSLSAAHRCAEALSNIGATVWDAAPYFHEFIVHAPRGGEETVQALADEGVFGGFPLGRVDPSLDDALLVCATDLTTRADLEALSNAWRAVHRG
ncbi:MAG: aminomethyl-transferring glycine dehydrogenase subunit GcvPA [Chloroflexi bacterium]|nr:aminomethyl-transferring glycine dehydrogenase subunit GcvPA [Chloroflexota bacterium]MCY4110772.1 aminomethyl-transferring glycine dehydrogenase subunit GcvPA [Chloroflexota bacterium]